MLNYMYFVNWSLEKNFPGGWGWVVGSAENRASSAPIELGLGLSLATTIKTTTATTFMPFDTMEICPVYYIFMTMK